MKRFLLLMLCLSGLLACSKDKTEDVPPVPPGSEEIPDKLELKAGDTDFNSLAYTVTAGKDGNEYLHVVYDYEGENETYIEASVENSSSILYDKEIRNKPRTRRTKRNV